MEAKRSDQSNNSGNDSEMESARGQPTENSLENLNSPSFGISPNLDRRINRTYVLSDSAESESIDVSPCSRRSIDASSNSENVDEGVDDTAIQDPRGIEFAKWKLIPIDFVSTPSCSPIDRRSILSTGGRPLRPLAFSTPMVHDLNETFIVHSGDSNFSNYDRTPAAQSISSISTASIDDSIVYYGAPMPGTPTERRDAMFRDALSDFTTPSFARVHEAPSNSSAFDPKLTSTADASQLRSPPDFPSSKLSSGDSAKESM